MANDIPLNGTVPGYTNTENAVPKKGQSAPPMADGDTYAADARGNIKLAAPQKNILTRDGSTVSNRFGKYKY